MHELPCFNRLWHTAAVLSADLGNMMKTARRWVCSLLVYWLVNRLLKLALKPQFFSSLRIKKTWLPGMLGNPREEQKTHQPARSHTSSTSSQSGEGSVLHLRHWLQSSNQRTHSELQYASSWAGKHRPPTPPPPPPPPALHSVGGIHYNNKPHSFQGHSLTAREISDTDQHFRLSLPLRVSDAGRELMLV